MFEIIDLVYEAAESPEVWGDVTEQLCKVIGANSGFIMIEDHNAGQIQDYIEYGIPDGSMARYAEYYLEKDIWTNALYAKGRENTFIHCNELVSQKTLKNTEIFVDFFRGYDIHNACGYFSPLTDASSLRIGFQTDKSGFSDRGIADINQFELHICRSMQLYHQQNQIKNFTHSDESPIANLALVIVDTKGSLIETNNRFDQLLQKSSLFKIEQGYLCFKEQKLHNALFTEIKRVVNEFNHLNLARKAPSYVLDNGMLEKYVISVSPYIHRAEGGRKYCALLTFRPLILESRQYSRLLKEQFNLTESELKIVLSLCDGKSVANIAAERVRSEHTVRTQLKEILYKFSCENQNQLVHTVLNLFSMYR